MVAELMINRINHSDSAPNPPGIGPVSNGSKWPKPAAWIFTFAVVIVGYFLLGPLPAALFAAGYLGGLILWLTVPTKASYQQLRATYFLALALFIAHKLEERYFGFFPALAEITGVSPDPKSILAKLLYVLAAAWLTIPFLLRRQHPFGTFLAWTFFASMGLTELAHFAFPFIAGDSPSYFPGLATASLLVPAGLWGLSRMWTATNPASSTSAGHERTKK